MWSLAITSAQIKKPLDLSGCDVIHRLRSFYGIHPPRSLNSGQQTIHIQKPDAATLMIVAGANTDSVAGLRFISVHLYIAGPIASTEYFLWPDKPPACCTLDQNDSVLQKN